MYTDVEQKWAWTCKSLSCSYPRSRGGRCSIRKVFSVNDVVTASPHKINAYDYCCSVTFWFGVCIAHLELCWSWKHIEAHKFSFWTISYTQLCYPTGYLNPYLICSHNRKYTIHTVPHYLIALIIHPSATEWHRLMYSTGAQPKLKL